MFFIKVQPAAIGDINFSRPKQFETKLRQKKKKQITTVEAITVADLEELQAIPPEAAVLTTLDSDAIDSSETDSASEDEEDGLPEPLTSYFSIEHQELYENELEEVVHSEMLRVKKNVHPQTF